MTTWATICDEHSDAELRVENFDPGLVTLTFEEGGKDGEVQHITVKRKELVAMLIALAALE